MYRIIIKPNNLEKPKSIFNKELFKYSKFNKKEKEYIKSIYLTINNPNNYNDFVSKIDKELIDNSKHKIIIKKMIFHITLNNYEYSNNIKYIEFIYKNYDVIKGGIKEITYGIRGGKQTLVKIISKIPNFMRIFLLYQMCLKQALEHYDHLCNKPYITSMLNSVITLQNKYNDYCEITNYLLPGQYFYKRWVLRNDGYLNYMMLFCTIHQAMTEINNWHQNSIQLAKLANKYRKQGYPTVYSILFYKKKCIITLKELTILKIIEDFILVPYYYPETLLTIRLRK